MYFNKFISKSFLIIALFFSAISNVYAQSESIDETEVDEFNILGWTFGMGASYFALDKENATRQKVGDTAFSIDLFASYYLSSRLAASAGVGFMQLDDEAEFTQQVVETNILGSDEKTATSEVSAIQVYSDFQYVVTNASSPVQFKAGVGYGTIASSDRKIENCSNCKKEDVDLEGGAYGTASIYRGIADDKYNIGLTARQYFGGDIKNTATLWFEYIY